MSDSITYNSVIFLLFLFIAIVVFSILSDPVDTILDAILGMDGLTSSSQIDTYVPYIKTAVKIAFSLTIATPVVWFIIKIFSREPAYYNRYNRGNGGTF